MAAQTIHLPVSLERGPDCLSKCAECLKQRLARRPGVRAVELTGAANGNGHAATHGGAAAATLALEYDPDVLSLASVNRLLRQAGGCLSERMAHVVLKVTGMVSPRQEAAVEAALEKVPGVRAIASYASGTIRVEFDREQCALPTLVDRLEDLGLRLAPVPVAARDGAGEAAARRWRTPGWLALAVSSRELVFAVVGGAMLVAAFALGLAEVTGPLLGLRYALLAGAYFFCGYHAAVDAWRTIVHLRFDIDILMLAAAVGAGTLGHFDEGALLLLLFAMGGAGEELAITRARRAIEALTRIAPATAQRVEPDGTLREVKVEELAIGDLVAVAPGQRIAADGVVESGSSAVDQAALTGESVPVDKAAGDGVLAGTINGQGALRVRVGKRAADNTLAKLIRLVEEAQTSRSPTQQVIEKLESWYVPLVLGATAALVVAPPLLGLTPRFHPDLPWAGWFYQAMAFLTAASPCALAIGTPAAVLGGIARSARGGVLIKGGVHLENLGRVEVVAFDKTGTLTRGQPRVTTVEVLDAARGADEWLTIAAAVERSSGHPLAAAVVAEAGARGLAVVAAEGVEQTPGVGIRAAVDGMRVELGRAGKLPVAGDAWGMLQRADALAAAGQTVIAMTVDGRPAALIGLMDQPRPSAAQAIALLRRVGVRHTIMLTGDSRAAAEAVARQVGVDECLAELMPQDKLDEVRRLSGEHGRVAMVGDGVNDAPAMANATVGIAIGGASSGSDVALETADAVLMTDDLTQLADAVRVARYCRRIVAQNLAIALGVIGVVAPLAALGFTNLAAAVLLHEGSTVVVVVNALRTLRLGRLGRS